MQEPSLQSYGLSEIDVASLQRRAEILPSRLTSACAAVGALCGFFIGASTGEKGVAFSYAWLGFIGGAVVAGCGVDALLKLVWNRDARFQRYAQFKLDLNAFEAAVKEAEVRELRTRAAFWQALPGHRFEHELAALFKLQGYDVTVTRGSGDGGVDIFLRRSGRTTVVQCKQTTHPVGPAAARELYACLMHFNADNGILATVGGVTSGVHEYFSGKPLRVMDLSEILELHREMNGASDDALGVSSMGNDERRPGTPLVRRGASGVSTTTRVVFRELQEVKAERPGHEVDALVEKGIEDFGRDPETALVCFEGAIELDAQCARAWRYRGLTLGKLSRWTESIESYDMALSIDSSDNESWIGKGQILVELGRLEDALRCYDAALHISPESWAALEGKGLTWHRLQRFQEAVLCFEKAAEVARNTHSRSWAWNYKGTSLLRMGRDLEALEWCDKAIDASPTESTFWITKGNCLRNLRRFEEALKCYERALSIWPRDWMAWFNKALVQEDLGRPQAAIAAYRSALDVAPPDATDIERAQKRLRKLEASE